MIFVASTTMGLESVVKDECFALGFKNIKVFDGRVEFEGDFKDLVKANIYLRCSDRSSHSLLAQQHGRKFES